MLARICLKRIHSNAVLPNSPTVLISLIKTLLFIQSKNPYMDKETILTGLHSDAISIVAIIVTKWENVCQAVFFFFPIKNGDES